MPNKNTENFEDYLECDVIIPRIEVRLQHGILYTHCKQLKIYITRPRLDFTRMLTLRFTRLGLRATSHLEAKSRAL